MLKILFVGLLIAYGGNILVNFRQLIQIWKGLYRLNRFIDAYTHKHNFRRKRKVLLRYFPIISRHLGIHSESLYYSDETFTTYCKAIPMRDALLSKRDFQFHKLIGTFNPLSALKAACVFPSQFLLWCGFRPKRIYTATANIAGIFLEVMLAKVIDVHYSELKTFAISALDTIWDILNNIS